LAYVKDTEEGANEGVGVEVIHYDERCGGFLLAHIFSIIIIKLD